MIYILFLMYLKLYKYPFELHKCITHLMMVTYKSNAVVLEIFDVKKVLSDATYNEN